MGFKTGFFHLQLDPHVELAEGFASISVYLLFWQTLCFFLIQAGKLLDTCSAEITSYCMQIFHKHSVLQKKWPLIDMAMFREKYEQSV